MKYSFLITSEMRKRITKMNLSKVIADKLESDLANNRQLGNDAKTSSPKVKIQRMNIPSGPRLVFFEEINGDNTIYVLREIYTEHDVYMRKFNNIKDINIWISWYAYKEEEKLEIENKFKLLKQKITKAILPEEFRTYEKRPRRFEASTDVIVYEMLEWVNGFADVDDLYKKSIFDALAAIIVFGKYDPNRFDNNGFYIFEVEEYKIAMRFDHPSERMNGVYLLQIAESLSREELVEHKYDCKDVTLLQRKAAKCYPNFLLLDFRPWKAIEDDSQANLSLSDEELDILQHIEYPFFVSGLAGSGKSTILYYLYAHIYDYESKEHPNHKLLFLSYSKKLVTNAQNIVRSILCNHPAYGLKSTFEEDKEKSRRFDKSFQPFQEFIKSEFLSMDELEIFSSGKYIDYLKFKQLYLTCKLPESKNYSPDIVWSVIRTFIKGKNNGSVFTPLDYENESLPAKDRTVTKEDYRHIYKIWENWYKKFFEDKVGWDDLDLVRYALSKYDDGTQFHKYAVIFCDEAQDFTKIETDLILKLSVYSKYNLSTREEDAKIPIAFAGDPNQTINPTGFRWGSTQEIFNDSFKDCLATFAGFKPNELRNNYRSREGIVKLANTIQYVRNRLLSNGKQHLSLQRPWDYEQIGSKSEGDGFNYVAFYSLDKNKETILKGMQKAVIITADDGEYKMDHVQTDPNLMNVDPSKLYTAITAKGLEFKATILYKFGSDPAVPLFEKLINGEQINDDSAMYQLSHLFTKLYIAISRAKQVLFIVDSEVGYDKLWKYFIDRDLWERFLKKYMPLNLDSDNIGLISIGNIFDFEHRLAENYRPKEYAESLFKNAIEEEDPETMKRARSAYKEAKYEDKAELCKAYMYKFSRNYDKAGETFLALNKYDLSLEAYWEGRNWSHVLLILQVGQKDLDGWAFKKAVALFMAMKTPSPLSDFLKNWKDNEDDFQDSLSNPKDRDLWNSIVNQICSIAKELKPKDITAALVRTLDRFSDYFDWCKDVMTKLRAELHFKRAEFENRYLESGDPEFNNVDYNAAILCWEKLQGQGVPNDYFKAKKIVSKTPSEKILWMEKLGEIKEILSQYGSVEIAPTLTEDAQNRVFNCLVAIDMSKALEYPYPKDSSAKWNSLYTKDRVNFLRMIILSDFSLDKFNFLQEKVAMDDYNAFQSRLPEDVFDAIFSLNGSDANGRPYWTLFISCLKNRIGDDVFRSAINRDTILESLSRAIMSSDKINKSLATCFLSMLFDEQYNFGRARKHLDILLYMFKRDIFFKEDFRIATKRNDYFTLYCPMEEGNVDRIKGNIHKFTHEYLTGISKRINATQAEDIVKPLFMAFEISAPYLNNHPDYANISNEYNKVLNDNTLKIIYELPSIWLEQRLIFNQLLREARANNSSFSQIHDAFLSKDYDLGHFVKMLSIEDTIAYIIATNRAGSDYSYYSTLITATVIYCKHLRWDDFKPYCVVKQLRDTIANFLDEAIKELLGNMSHVNEYEMKLLTYVWEVFGDHLFVASHYDDLLDYKRLDKVSRLKNYLKRRALYHYSFLLNTKDFEEKQVEYNVTMNRESAYPKIEKDDEGKKPLESKPFGMQSGANYEPQRIIEKATPNDPVKQAMIEMARKMKASGMEIDQIMTFTNLSESEINNA